MPGPFKNREVARIVMHGAKLVGNPLDEVTITKLEKKWGI
jgi:hypothetical protein